MELLTDEEKIARAKEEVDSIIASGKYKVVDESIFEGLDNLVITERNIGEADYTLDLYQEFFDDLVAYPEEFQLQFLEGIKNADVIDNQAIEKENTFLISIFMTMHKQSAIDFLIRNVGEPITKEEFVAYHDMLLEGSSSYKETGLRENNLKYVGELVRNENGEKERKIDYFPLRYQDIDKVLKIFLDYYNANLDIEPTEYDALIRPIIYHGLLAALQLFKDGNTRYGRLIQNVEIWRNVNKTRGLDLPMPLIYASRQYAAFRGEYRKLVSDIAKGKEGAWDNWINFNLRRLQDSIYASRENLYNLAQRSHVTQKDSKPFHI